ncbi:MAG: 2-isopropylmalate synthase [Methanobacteriota archaeon]|nr:MAG: 2-isopropylmalate synthase [Euryarchaeota archaeon]
MSYVEIMDTTLRDGEQVFGVSYTAEEKLTIAKFLLEKVKVDRVEVASCLSSERDKRAVSMISEFSEHKLKKPYKVEVLCFLNEKSLKWAQESGAKTINLLAKGSVLHLREQLKKSKEEHFKDIRKIATKGVSQGMRVNIYLEDVSYGIGEDSDYVRSLLNLCEELEFSRVMLPDTRGILSPKKVREYFEDIVKDYRKLTFDFHGHNDYGLATANSLEALELGFNGVHGTVNGMGERAGNTPLEEIVVAINDFTKRRCSVQEKYLSTASMLVQRMSGKRVSWNKPIVGDYVFTHVAGIHADGEKKGNIYTSKLEAGRFGREKSYSIGKLSGKASIQLALKNMGINLSKEKLEAVLKKVVEIAEKKETLTEADLLYMLSDVLEMPVKRVFKVLNATVVSEKELDSAAILLLEINGEKVKASGKGCGGFDAFMNSIKKPCKERGLFIPQLIDYEVGIPKGGETDSLVEATITWMNRKGNYFKTVGVSPDQVMAAIYAASKAINYANIREPYKNFPKK